MKKYFFQKIHWAAIAAVIAALLLALSAVSCTEEKQPDSKLTVAVTILPQAGFVKAVGGDKVDVLVMVPPGASPHSYEVTTDQMTRLSKAAMYAKVGSPVEFEVAWMDKLIGVNQSMTVIDCSRGIQLIEAAGEEHEHEHEAESGEENEHEHEAESDHEHSGLDPHIWLSVHNVKIMVQNICDGLVQVDSANSSFYEKNCAEYLNELSSLDSELTADLADVKNRSFIVFHPSFGYFARDYDLEQIAVEQDGKEPDTDYLVRLIEEAKEHDIKVVFVSPQYDTRSAESVAKEIGGKVVIINPLAEEFIENMHNIETAMKEAMQ